MRRALRGRRARPLNKEARVKCIYFYNFLKSKAAHFLKLFYINFTLLQ